MQGSIVTEGVTVAFGKRDALCDVGLELVPGVTALMGPNGAGKTTLIEVLAGIRQPTRGHVLLNGRRLRGTEKRSLRSSVGVLPQELGFPPRLTPREFIRFVAWLKKVPNKELESAVDRALDSVEMLDRADNRLSSLSGGMLRRVGFAQAIVNRPDVLLLDEPTVGLDPDQRVRLRDLVRQQGAETTVVLSTHLAEDVAHLADRVCVLQQGRVVFWGETAELAGVHDRDQLTATHVEDAYMRLGWEST